MQRKKSRKGKSIIDRNSVMLRQGPMCAASGDLLLVDLKDLKEIAEKKEKFQKQNQLK